MNKKAARGQFESYVSGGLATVLRLVRYAGLAPLHFAKKKDGWCISSSMGWTVYGYIIIIILNVITGMSLVSELQSDQLRVLKMRNNSRYDSVWAAQVGFMMMSSAVAVCAAPGQMRLMAALLNRVQMINSELNINCWPKSLGRKMAWLMIAHAVFSIVLSATESAWTMVSYQNSQVALDTRISGAHVFYYFCYWILRLRNVLFVAVVMHVKYSFTVVNDHLRSLLRDLENFPLDVVKKATRLNNYVNPLNDVGKTDTGLSKSEAQQQWVRHLALVYSVLCELVRAVDRAHGPMVLLLLANYMLHYLCTSCYYITYLIGDGTTKWNLPWVSIMLLWFIFHTFCLVMTIEPCHWTHMEMAQTRKLVNSLIGCSHSSFNEPLGMELEQFFRHLLLNEVLYKPLKVTTMSRKLVFTILKCVTTYTVIIIHLHI